MKDKTITRKISQGMYVLTTEGGGCIVDAVSQISAGENPLICVAVMKSNYTNELLKKNNKFAISVLAMDVDPKIIDTFGMKSMRECDKFSYGFEYCSSVKDRFNNCRKAVIENYYIGSRFCNICSRAHGKSNVRKLQ